MANSPREINDALLKFNGGEGLKKFSKDAKSSALNGAKKEPMYQKRLTRIYGGREKIPLHAVKRAAEGKGRSAGAYSKYLAKNK